MRAAVPAASLPCTASASAPASAAARAPRPVVTVTRTPGCRRGAAPSRRPAGAGRRSPTRPAPGRPAGARACPGSGRRPRPAAPGAGRRSFRLRLELSGVPRNSASVIGPVLGANRFTPRPSLLERTSAFSAARASGVLSPPARKANAPDAATALASRGVLGPPAIGAATTGNRLPSRVWAVPATTTSSPHEFGIARLGAAIPCDER